MHFCWRISLNLTGSNWTSSKRGPISSAGTIRRERWMVCMLDSALRSDWPNVSKDQYPMGLEIGNLSQYRRALDCCLFHHWYLDPDLMVLDQVRSTKRHRDHCTSATRMRILNRQKDWERRHAACDLMGPYDDFEPSHHASKYGISLRSKPICPSSAQQERWGAVIGLTFAHDTG